MSKIDFSKPVRTKDGRPVEIISTKLRNPTYKTMGYVGDSISATCWTKDGKYYPYDSDSANDLENIPKEQTYYINIYKCEFTDGLDLGVRYSTRELADLNQDPERVGCVKVTLKEGQYDE